MPPYGINGSGDSSVGIPTSYGMDGRDSIPGRGERFCLIHRVQTGSGAHPASYPMGIEDSFPGVNRLGREADHPHPSSAEVKNGGAISPLPRMASRHGA
jgi:hypothetical protein